MWRSRSPIGWRACWRASSRSNARIGENIETVQRTFEAIHTALQQQSKTCLEAAQVELLRADVRRFEI